MSDFLLANLGYLRAGVSTGGQTAAAMKQALRLS
jgi:hypothetical protein